VKFSPWAWIAVNAYNAGWTAAEQTYANLHQLQLRAASRQKEKEIARACARIADAAGSPKVADQIDATFGTGAFDNGKLFHEARRVE